MLLFSFSSHDYLARDLVRLCGLERGEFAVHRFSNQELYLTVRACVRGEHCLVIGWPLGGDGRKLYSGTALFGEDGSPRAFGRGTWLRIALP